MVTDRLTAAEVDNASALRECLAVDRPSGEIFRGLARLVAHVFDAPAVCITFVHDERPWLELCSAPDLVVSRSVLATAPLLSNGRQIGSISIRDASSRSFDAERQALLEEFATQVVQSFESRLEALREREIERYRLDVLKLAANDAPLQEIFDNLVDCVEFCIEGSSCTIALVREGGLYGASAGASLPASYLAEIEGLRIGPGQGSCGTAAERKEPVIVSNVALDPLWSKYRHIAAAAGIASCWSTPITNSDDVVLGTLAIYRSRPSEPTLADLAFTNEAAHVAAIAIEANNSRMKLEQMALHDPLTDLPNRALFEDRMHQAIATARRTGRCLAIGLMDLNHFKLVNDSLGHAAGDRLLVDVANRLRSVVRPQDTVARMGGDEFLLLMPDLDDREAARAIAERFVAILEPSFMPCGREVFVRGSMGVSVYPDDAREASQLLRQADSAMYVAKASGERIGFFEAGSRSDVLTRLETEGALHRALEKRELELRYRPLVRVADGSMHSVEALLTWHHPRLGAMGPETFMPIAEESGLTVEIGTWLLDEACRFARRWRDAGGAGTVWVDVSARQFEHADFTSYVMRALAAANVAPSALCLQITEPLIMRLSENVAKTLGQLRRLGVTTAIADFGTGYSSLNVLKTFPVGAVKIGRELLHGVGAGSGVADEAIVRAILGVGQTLGVAIVAQGVDSPGQHAFVAQSGFELAQGAYFSDTLTEADVLGS